MSSAAKTEGDMTRTLSALGTHAVFNFYHDGRKKPVTLFNWAEGLYDVTTVLIPYVNNCYENSRFGHLPEVFSGPLMTSRGHQPRPPVQTNPTPEIASDPFALLMWSFWQELGDRDTYMKYAKTGDKAFPSWTWDFFHNKDKLEVTFTANDADGKPDPQFTYTRKTLEEIRDSIASTETIKQFLEEV